uniref:Uncharacterized protein n=1 Tax=Leersia perrieri TaxID=77586 RepID=A0A0D9W7P2_9ORYZ
MVSKCNSMICLVRRMRVEIARCVALSALGGGDSIAWTQLRQNGSFIISDLTRAVMAMMVVVVGH